ncbi:hypothetical protein Aperf_G00000076855 [Anoplocephala perfoliata]
MTYLTDDVDIIIYIASRLPSYSMNIPLPLVEDLLEADSIQSFFDDRYCVYTPTRIKRLIRRHRDITRKNCDSAARAAVLKTNLTDVDVVIYIEDLLEAHSIHPLFDDQHNVYTSRYMPRRNKRIIFAPIGKIPFSGDGTLKIYDSATQAGVLAFLGSFNKNGENILLMIGPEIFANEIPWRTRRMIYLNTILGTLYSLYEPQTSKQRYQNLYIYNASADVIRFSKGVENGRRVARDISSKADQHWTADSIVSMFSKIFNNTIIGQEIYSYPLKSNPEGRIVYLNYIPSGAKKTVYLISVNSTERGISTIAGFFKILEDLQPNGTKYRAAIVCLKNYDKFLLELRRGSLNKKFCEVTSFPKFNATDLTKSSGPAAILIFRSNPLQKSSQVHFVGPGGGMSSRMGLQYHGESADFEFGPHTMENNLKSFINVGENGSPGNANFTEDEYVDHPFTSPLTALVTRFLLPNN